MDEMKQAMKPVVRIRVKKEDIKPASWVSPDPLDECLSSWKAWMGGDADRDLGAKTMSGLVGDDDAYGVDSSEAQQARDTRIAIATDAMIDSLKRIHIWAIYEGCGIGTVWKFPNADLITQFGQARAELEQKLRKNVCTGVLF